MDRADKDGHSNSRLAAPVLRRPLFFCAVLFGGGVYAASTGVFPAWAWGALAVCAVFMALALPGLITARLLSVAFAALAVGALAWHSRHAGPSGDELSRMVDTDGLPRDCVVEGVVRLQNLDNDEPRHVRFLLQADAVELAGRRRRVDGGVMVSCSNPPWTVHAGERVRARGKVSARFGFPNFGVASHEAYWARRGVYSSLRVESRHGSVAGLERVARARWWSGRYWMSRLRKGEADRLALTVPASALPFVKAVWLGYRASMPRHEYRKYVKAGVAHILAVSGIHATIIYLTAGFLLRFVVKNRRWWALLAMLAVVGFALTTGIRPSALRAALMITVFLSAELAGRPPDVLSALGLSALVLLGWNPDLLFDNAFQLSFLSVASILLFGSRLESVLPGPGLLRKPLSASLAVQVLPLPVAVKLFHVLPGAGVLLNLAVIPLSAAILWLTFVTLLVSVASIDAASLFGHALSPLFWVVARLVDAVASSNWTWLRVVSPTGPAQLAYWGAAACVLAAATAARRGPWVKAAGLLAIGAVLTWRLNVPEARLDFLSVDNGDSVAVMSSRGRVMLVDGGDAGESFSNGEVYVAPYLWSNHIRRLEYVVASHSDRDHLGGLFYIVENFEVGEVWLPAVAGRTPLERHFETLCARRGVPVRRVEAGHAVRFDDLAVRVLHPPAGWTNGRSANDCSLVMSVERGQSRVLLTGDIEEEAERLVAGEDCRATVMKAPHHGSATSSSAFFVDAVAPAECVITCAGAPLNRVSRETIATYEARGCRVWRTDILGGVRVKLTDKPKTTAVRPWP